MTRFLLEDWTAVTPQNPQNPNPTLSVLDTKTPIEVAVDAVREKQKIRLFEISVGPCVFDTCPKNSTS